MISSPCKAQTFRSDAGFTYIGVLFAVALMGAMLVAVATIWQQVQQREKEKELLFIGKQFSQAIGSYYDNSPGQIKQFPKTLDDLLEDRRFPYTRRHLRKIFYDPITGSTDWGLVKGADDGIIGVYSKSEDRPLMQALIRAETYAEWTFSYKPKSAVAKPVVTTPIASNITGAPVSPPAGNVNPPPNMPTISDISVNNPDDPCYDQYANDYLICLEACQKVSFETCTACYASRQQRTLACKHNQPLPPLITE